MGPFPELPTHIVLPILGVTFGVLAFTFFQSRRPAKKYPPIVTISSHEMFSNPRQAYERALATYGPIVGVRRKGQVEYIVNDQYTHDVLTTHSSLSFERGTAHILNLGYFLKLVPSFFVELDDLVRNVIVSRMPLVVEQVFPSFMRIAKDFSEELAPTSGRPPKYIDAEVIAHRGIAEAMAHVILGKEFVDQVNLDVIERVAHDMATVTGMYQNTSWFGKTFPDLWKTLNWLTIIFTTIPLFYRTIGYQMWKKLRSDVFSPEDAKENPEFFKGSVVNYLACKKADQNGRVGILSFAKISAVVLGIIFASVHQTASVAVWILYELATRTEYLPELREEMSELAALDPTSSSPEITYDALQKAVKLDSFIREVMRTKGDTLSTVRMTTSDVSLAGVVIPKGFLVFPLASLSHLSTAYHGKDAERFDGRRWVGTGKQAVMVNETYFPFGLGRWSCPGRNLAVAEIKMIVWSILCRATPVLRGGTYSVPDPLNVTSVAPTGEMTMLPLAVPRFEMRK